MKIRNHVFVVTGGGNGIGREVVLDILSRGGRVAAVDLSAPGLATTAERAAAGERLTTHEIDITDRAAVEALPDAVIAAHGQVDGLINVAGIVQPFIRIADLGYDVIEKVLAVNLWGTIHTTKSFLPALLKRPTASVVNVSSMGGLAPVPGQSAYGASKAAVKLFTEGLYAELQGTNVAVTVVFPGGVATDILGNSGVERGGGSTSEPSTGSKLTTAPDAARQIVDATEKGAFRVRIGKDARLLDRLSRLMPQRTPALIAKKMASLLD